jgi:p-hydroxybenzoate 3-monooxygenase
MRTRVGIVGAGPAGLLLSLLLQRAGVDCVVLESRSREYVESRVRAGVLEEGTVALIDELGAGERLHREGMPDPRLDIRFSGGTIHIDLPVLTPGKIVTVYGQQEVVKDLIAARLARGGTILFEAEASHIEGLTGERPTIHFKHEGEAKTLECDMVAGCDGFHGICRAAIPENLLTVYDRIFPFGWLGILAESKPFPEMSYSSHERGFSLASRRSPTLSRLYVQCTTDEDLAGWSDRRIWDELQLRLYAKDGELTEGPILQRGVTPCRAEALRPDVPRRRRRPHRAADRREGAQSCRGRHSCAVAGADRVFPHRRDRAARPLFRHLPEARVEGRTLFQLHDLAAASLRRAHAVRAPRAAGRAGICRRFAGGPDHHRRKLRRPAVRGGLTASRLLPILPTKLPKEATRGREW